MSRIEQRGTPRAEHRSDAMAYQLPPARLMPRSRDDETLWDVADADGNTLVSRITRAQLRARLEAGLLQDAALASRSGERALRPISEVLGGSGARRITRWWYVTRPGGEVVGPVETTRIERGIVARRVPLDSMVCEVGQAYWAPIADVVAFARAIEEAQFDEEVTTSIAVG